MGLLKAVAHTDTTLWIEALKHYLQEQLAVNSKPEALGMKEQLNRAMEDLKVVAQYLSK
jgi:hypothetical protein